MWPTWVMLVGLAYGASPSLGDIDEAAESAYDHAGAAKWSAAARDEAKLRALCEGAGKATCDQLGIGDALDALRDAVRHHRVRSAQLAANEMTARAAPQLDAKQGAVGVAPLDPAVRQLAMDVQAADAVATSRDLDALDALISKLRCAPADVATFSGLARDARRSPSRGTVARLDEGVDQLERHCLPAAGSGPGK